MKDFLKFTLATVTGIILSSIVLFIIDLFNKSCEFLFCHNESGLFAFRMLPGTG